MRGQGIKLLTAVTAPAFNLNSADAQKLPASTLEFPLKACGNDGLRIAIYISSKVRETAHGDWNDWNGAKRWNDWN